MINDYRDYPDTSRHEIRHMVECARHLLKDSRNAYDLQGIFLRVFIATLTRCYNHEAREGLTPVYWGDTSPYFSEAEIVENLYTCLLAMSRQANILGGYRVTEDYTVLFARMVVLLWLLKDKNLLASSIMVRIGSSVAIPGVKWFDAVETYRDRWFTVTGSSKLFPTPSPRCIAADFMVQRLGLPAEATMSNTMWILAKANKSPEQLERVVAEWRNSFYKVTGTVPMSSLNGLISERTRVKLIGFGPNFAIPHTNSSSGQFIPHRLDALPRRNQQ